MDDRSRRAWLTRDTLGEGPVARSLSSSRRARQATSGDGPRAHRSSWVVAHERLLHCERRCGATLLHAGMTADGTIIAAPISHEGSAACPCPSLKQTKKRDACHFDYEGHTGIAPYGTVHILTTTDAVGLREGALGRHGQELGPRVRRIRAGQRSHRPTRINCGIGCDPRTRRVGRSAEELGKKGRDGHGDPDRDLSPASP